MCERTVGCPLRWSRVTRCRNECDCEWFHYCRHAIKAVSSCCLGRQLSVIKPRSLAPRLYMKVCLLCHPPGEELTQAVLCSWDCDQYASFCPFIFWGRADLVGQMSSHGCDKWKCVRYEELLCIKGIVHTKVECLLTICAPSNGSKPLCIFLNEADT